MARLMLASLMVLAIMSSEKPIVIIGVRELEVVAFAGEMPETIGAVESTLPAVRKLAWYCAIAWFVALCVAGRTFKM